MAFKEKKIKVRQLENKQEVATQLGGSDLLTSDKNNEKIAEFYNQKKELFRLEKPAYSLSPGLIIILSLIFGLVGGLLTSFFLLTRENIRLPFIGGVDLKKMFPQKEVTLVTEKEVTVTSDLRLADLSCRLRPQLMTIYRQKTAKKNEITFLEQIYSKEEAFALAGILTDDGWLVAAGDFGPQEGYFAANNKNKFFVVKKIITDPLTKLNFLKIKAEDLPVVNFISNREEIIQGRQVVLFDKQGKFYQDSISHPSFLKITKKEDLIRSTDYFSEEIILERDYSQPDFLGSFVFGLDGLVLGIVGQKKIIPYWQFEKAISSFLSEGKTSQNYFGIDYIRISDAPGLLNPSFKDLEYGAIVYGEPEKGSPFAQSLKNADIIIKVDSLPLKPDINFTELIQKKKTGQEIKLTILREGEEKEIKGKL